MIPLEQQQLVKDSFAKVFSHKAPIGAACYKHLFDSCPETQSLFQEGFSQKHQMLVDELALIVRAMGSDKPLPQVERLNRLHDSRGVTADHFPHMRAALLRGIGEEIGDAFTPAHADAWGAAFDHLIKQMVPSA